MGFSEKYVVDKDSGCWNWIANYDSTGRPIYFVDNQVYAAATYNYVANGRGQIPPGGFVIPSCKNIKCVNPEHLYIGTWIEYKDALSDQLIDQFIDTATTIKTPDEPYDPVNTDKKRRLPIAQIPPAVESVVEPVELQLSDAMDTITDASVVSEEEPIIESVVTEVDEADALAVMATGNDKYIMIDSHGNEYETLFFDDFCKEHNLKQRFMRGVLDGTYKQHKGWTCRQVQ